MHRQLRGAGPLTTTAQHSTCTHKHTWNDSQALPLPPLPPRHPTLQGYLEAKTKRMDHMIDNSYFSVDEADTKVAPSAPATPQTE